MKSPMDALQSKTNVVARSDVGESTSMMLSILAFVVQNLLRSSAIRDVVALLLSVVLVTDREQLRLWKNEETLWQGIPFIRYNFVLCSSIFLDLIAISDFVIRLLRPSGLECEVRFKELRWWGDLQDEFKEVLREKTVALEELDIE
ncbi:hypothetical protein ACLOJK_007253 [Asimina triloba]